MKFANMALVWLVLFFASAAVAQDTGILRLGDAVVTGFSGTARPDPETLLPDVELIDETFIDPKGVSARILDISAPGYVWNGSAWTVEPHLTVTAAEVGQVFGIALDDAEFPNIYLAATSVYGLPIVTPDADGDGRAERQLRGQADATFMPGLFGPMGGPGSIWRVDGRTGAVTRFAQVTTTPGAGLGNLAFDADHQQLFVSDRSTGLIHRFGLDGQDNWTFDHGVDGRMAAGLPASPYDPATALDITRADFDTEDPDSWGMPAPARQVWGLAVHDGRLFYSVVGDSQIWSVGIVQATGAFASDPRFEVDVPKRPAKRAVSDIVFSEQGAMIVAQRGPVTSAYDYTGLAEPDDSRVYRFWPEMPDDPATPDHWTPEPEEYAVGFGGDNRHSEGGVDLQYGYDSNGLLDTTTCEGSLLATGNDLRRDPDLADQLRPGGPLILDGLQAMPSLPVKPENTPPWFSYMINFDPQADDPEVTGHVGDVRVYRQGCGAGVLTYVTQYGGPGYPDDPPYVGDPVDGPKIWPVCLGSDCADPKFKVKKTCDTCKLDPETGRMICQCQITVTSNGVPFSGNLLVDEMARILPVIPANTWITAVSSADSWTCDQPPFAATDRAQCSIDQAGLAAAGNHSVIDVTLSLPDDGTAGENCAGLSLHGKELDKDCTPLTTDDKHGLKLDKTFAPNKDDPEGGSYTLTVTNMGAAFETSGAVQITDTVPAGMSIDALIGTDWNCGSLPVSGVATLTCTYTGSGILPAGGTLHLGMTASVGGEGEYENCAIVGFTGASNLTDANLDDNKDCARFGGEIHEISIEKTYRPVDGPVLYSGIFTLTVTNNAAPFETSGAIQITENVPAGLTLSGPLTGWTCGTLPVTGPVALTCDYTGSGILATGGQLTLDLHSQVPDGALYTNCALLDFTGTSGLVDAIGDNNAGCAHFGGQTHDVGIEKTYEPEGQGPTIHRGTFTLTVTNHGAEFETLGALQISDTIPAGMTVSTPVSAGWDCGLLPVTGPATLTCNYLGSGPLAAGGQLALTMNTTAPDGAEYQNCALVGFTASSGLTDTVGSNNSACKTIGDDGFTPVDPPPPFTPSCGMNVIFVVDESRSVADAGATWQITQAVQNAANIFNAHGAQAAVIRFSDNATVVYPMATASFGTVNNGYNPANSATNWEAAMQAALTLASTPNTMIVFITDGIPTAYLDGSGAVVYTSDAVLATNEAIGVVNQIYATGTPITGFGIGSVSTHLTALLGSNATTSSYGGLDGALGTFARNACPDIYLQKAISPEYTNIQGLTLPLHLTVTLSATNSLTTPVTGVTVSDTLPAPMTNPTGYSPAIVTGSTLTWTIPTLAAGATATLSFTVDYTPTAPVPTTNYACTRNFAQVTAADQTIASVPNNMTDALTGPVLEHDEASASACAIDYTPTTTDDCGSATLRVVKRANFSEICVPGGDPACTFSITVTAQCHDFLGPVLFGDGVTQGGNPVGATVTAATNTATPPICAWPAGWTSGTLPTSCAVPNFALPLGNSVTFTFTLDDPLPAGGGYQNCFVADGRPNQGADYISAMGSLTPDSAAYGGTWINCTPFSIGAPPQGIAPAGDPTCPQGKVMKGNTCVTSGPKPPICAPPAILTKDKTSCRCPKGFAAEGKSCIKITAKKPICNAPAVFNKARNACVCPEGTVVSGRTCVKPAPADKPKPAICIPPAVFSAARNACICPAGTMAVGKLCVKLPNTGTKPNPDDKDDGGGKP